MKTTTKLMAVTLICLAPLGLFANEYEDDGDTKNSKYSTFTTKLIKERGVNLIFEGEVKSKPKACFNGVWKISNKEIIVDDNTLVIMDENENFFLKNDDNEVEVLAKRENREIKAILIKSK